MNSRQRSLASIIKFRAQAERVSPAQAASMIIRHYGEGEQGLALWAKQHKLTPEQVLQVTYYLEALQNRDQDG